LHKKTTTLFTALFGVGFSCFSTRNIDKLS